MKESNILIELLENSWALKMLNQCCESNKEKELILNFLLEFLNNEINNNEIDNEKNEMLVYLQY